MNCPYCDDPLAYGVTPAQQIQHQERIFKPGRWVLRDPLDPKSPQDWIQGTWEDREVIGVYHLDLHPTANHIGVLCKNSQALGTIAN